MKPSEVMWDAAARVEKGWCQGEIEDRNGNVCAVGALQKAVESANARTCIHDYYWQTCVVVHRTLTETVGGSIVLWNNHPDTTQADVVTAMQKAAIALEETGQ